MFVNERLNELNLPLDGTPNPSTAAKTEEQLLLLLEGALLVKCSSANEIIIILGPLVVIALALRCIFIEYY